MNGPAGFSTMNQRESLQGMIHCGKAKCNGKYKADNYLSLPWVSISK